MMITIAQTAVRRRALGPVADGGGSLPFKSNPKT
jgi:hypothetical protein